MKSSFEELVACEEVGYLAFTHVNSCEEEKEHEL